MRKSSLGLGVQGVGIAGGVSLFARLAAALGSAVSGVHSFGGAARPTSTYKAKPVKSEAQRQYLLNRAEAKRARKAQKLDRDFSHATCNNWAHGLGSPDSDIFAIPHKPSLNPFHVAR